VTASIRPEAPGDVAAIREVVTAAFGGSDEVDLIDALRASDAWMPGLSRVAIEEGRLVGHVLYTRAFIRGDAEVPVLALAPVAVAPERQRRGIGDALVRAGLEVARGLGERLVVVVGHPAYYPRFGFQPAIPHGLSCVFARPGHEDTFMVLELQPGALQGVRGRVEYAAPFGAFE
jgi:predicted N-acetyltransferase YhbS